MLVFIFFYYNLLCTNFACYLILFSPYSINIVSSLLFGNPLLVYWCKASRSLAFVVSPIHSLCSAITKLCLLLFSYQIILFYFILLFFGIWWTYSFSGFFWFWDIVEILTALIVLLSIYLTHTLFSRHSSHITALALFCMTLFHVLGQSSNHYMPGKKVNLYSKTGFTKLSFNKIKLLFPMVMPTITLSSYSRVMLMSNLDPKMNKTKHLTIVLLSFTNNMYNNFQSF